MVTAKKRPTIADVLAKLAAAESDLAIQRAETAALKHCLADVLATLDPREMTKPETQLVRMRARVLAASVKETR